jgi:hypothetical protein
MIKRYADMFMMVVGVIADGTPSARPRPGSFPACRPAEARTAEADEHAAQSTHRRAEA